MPRALPNGTLNSEIIWRFSRRRFFVDLEEGKLSRYGIKLDGSNWSELAKNIDQHDVRLDKQEMELINEYRWFGRNINWDNSVLYCGGFSYCWVNFDVK